MGRHKKIKEDIKPTILVETEDINDIEDEDILDNVGILVGDYFKIVAKDRYWELYEKKKIKTKTKDIFGIETEVEIEKFKSMQLFPGTLISACNEIKQYIAKNKIKEKGAVESLDMAIKIIKDSYRETRKLFEGIEGI